MRAGCWLRLKNCDEGGLVKIQHFEVIAWHGGPEASTTASYSFNKLTAKLYINNRDSVHTAHSLGLEFGAHWLDWFEAVHFMHCETAIAGTSTLFPDLNGQNAYKGFK